MTDDERAAADLARRVVRTYVESRDTTAQAAAYAVGADGGRHAGHVVQHLVELVYRAASMALNVDSQDPWKDAADVVDTLLKFDEAEHEPPRDIPVVGEADALARAAQMQLARLLIAIGLRENLIPPTIDDHEVVAEWVAGLRTKMTDEEIAQLERLGAFGEPPNAN